MPTNVFLLWSRLPGEEYDPEVVARRLRDLFGPLFAYAPMVTVRQTGSTCLVYLELPVRDWAHPFVEEGAGRWAIATDYPLGAQAELEARGLAVGSDGVLLALSGLLEESPAPLLRRMPAPFALAWSDQATGDTFIQNDGLGLAQLFEYRKGEAWATTNRLMAFRALGIGIEPVPEEWAARWALDHFPMDMSGYRDIRYIAPATQIRVGQDGIRQRTEDVIPEWLGLGAGAGTSAERAAEEVAHALLEHVREVMGQWTAATALFSGGRDSRAVVALLRAAGARFACQVGGVPGNPDVIVASELARIAGLELAVDDGTLPADDLEGTRRSIESALLWEAGYRLVKKHKTFLAGGGFLHGGRVKVTGKHGEFARQIYAKGVALEASPEAQEAAFVRRWLGHLPPSIQPRWRPAVEDIIVTMYRQADGYGLVGQQRLFFYFLRERTRRLLSGSHSAKSGLVFTPLMHPDYIRAAFQSPFDALVRSPIHDRIVASYAPDWTTTPFADDAAGVERIARRDSLPRARSDGSVEYPEWARMTKGRNYDNASFWSTTGRALVDECLRSEGFWSTLFDREMAASRRERDADRIVITYLLAHVAERHLGATEP